MMPNTLRQSVSKADRIIYNTMSRDASKTVCMPEDIEKDSCTPYYVFSWASSGARLTITRSYKDFLSTIGDIGGVNELILIFIALAYSYYHSFAFRNYMIREVYYGNNFDVPDAEFVKDQDSRLETAK